MSAIATSIFQARLDPGSKSIIEKAAKLRGISQTDYLKAILIPFAKQEILEAENGGVKLSKIEQSEFWQALNEPVKLTINQKKLSQRIQEFL